MLGKLLSFSKTPCPLLVGGWFGMVQVGEVGKQSRIPETGIGYSKSLLDSAYLPILWEKCQLDFLHAWIQHYYKKSCLSS